MNSSAPTPVLPESTAIPDQVNHLVPLDTAQPPESAPSTSQQSSQEPVLESPESSQASGSFIAPLVDIISPVLNIDSQAQKDEHTHISQTGDVQMAEQTNLPIPSATTRVV